MSATMRIARRGVEVVDAVRVGERRPALDAEDLATPVVQAFGKIAGP